MFKPWQLRAGNTEHVLGSFSSFPLRDYSRLRVDSPLTLLNNLGTVKDHSTVTMFDVSLDAFCLMQWQ